MSLVAIQLGSREHYAVPRALFRAGELDALLTDSWLSRFQSNLVRPLAPALAARRSEEIPDRLVKSRTLGRLAIDIGMRLGGERGWDAILKRNAWFQDWVAREMESVPASTLFCYSYTANKPFAVCRRRGLRCFLGQIDPGPREEEVVSEATSDYRRLAPPAENAPQQYWDSWREEVADADKIVVNSPWSAKLLVEAGVEAGKLVEVPLVYTPSGSIERGAGSKETEEKLKTGNAKKLKALFLGSVILRKGVGQLFDAIKMLQNEPIDFTFAGPIGVRIPDGVSQMKNVRLLGPVDKATTEKLYRESDVFLFPTLSDGFGLTQLEALAHGLPVIASTNCGQVVENRVNGLLLDEVMPEAIAGAIMELVRDRDLLAKLKSNARVPDKCHPRHLAPALLALGKS